MAALLYWQGDRIPQLPFRYAESTSLVRAAVRCSEAIERIEGEFRRWPVATLSLLAVAALFGLAMLVGR